MSSQQCNTINRPDNDLKVNRILTYLLAVVLLFISCTHEPETEAIISDDLTPSPGATIYGKVTCAGAPVPGVCVSDGVNIVQTDEDGVYSICSSKRDGLVFISIPSGYATQYSGSTMPSFWKSLKSADADPERVDFALIKENQDNYTVLFLGDIHIYSYQSINIFNSTFVPEINKFIAGSDRPVYGVTLGDMTWDWYWYNDDKIGIEHYIPAMDKVSGIHVFNTVGNHDNDMDFNSLDEFRRTGQDWTCMTRYRKLQGPTCYSYNIGGVHYVSLDNVITTNKGGTTDKDSRGNWRGVTEADMNWLKQDLSYVSSDTPVIVTLHIPLFGRTGLPNSGNSGSVNYSVESITAPFKKFRKVLFISAHTHILYNTENYNVNGLSVTEWNNGALCGNFWYSATKGLNLCTDGTPGGYRVVDVDNGNIKSIYKGIGKKDNYIFRTYDRNMMSLDASKLGNYTTGGIAGGDNANWVYINIWDYKPSWTVSVKEIVGDSSRNLQPVMFESYDPLYMLMYAEKLVSTKPQIKSTMFKVQASSSTSTLIVRVTDEYGNSRVEQMARPKDFTVEKYMAEQAE